MAIGSGWQAIVAYVNLATYYLIGLPIGCVLGFKTSLGVVVSRISSPFLLVFLHASPHTHTELPLIITEQNAVLLFCFLFVCREYGGG